jgi:hypothetical protein
MNDDAIYVGYEIGWKHQYKIQKFNNEKELIAFLAEGFKGSFYDSILFCDKYFNNRLNYEYWDGHGRRITPQVYRNEAWDYFIKYLKNKPSYINKKRSYWVKKRIYKGMFRREPVEGIHKSRGWKDESPHNHKKALLAMYANPEYKKYNRGSHKEVEEWNYTTVEKNWKTQRKVRHQWEK